MRMKERGNKLDQISLSPEIESGFSLDVHLFWFSKSLHTFTSEIFWDSRAVSSDGMGREPRSRTVYVHSDAFSPIAAAETVDDDEMVAAVGQNW